MDVIPLVAELQKEECCGPWPYLKESLPHRRPGRQEEAVSTLISLINVEVGINMEGGIFLKKLVHNSNKRGVEGGKI